MKEEYIKADFCVIGGGLAGMCAAIAAARKGFQTVLMHDRAVLGGNASSEVRVRICGASAHNQDLLESGILEEIQLENLYRNPDRVYSIWDSILYGITNFQKNLTLLLNCSCNSLEMDGSRIKGIKGWQLTTETTYRVDAEFFADCSGDSILAPMCGAQFNIGREGVEDLGESLASEQTNFNTMGMSCLIQARKYDVPKSFIPPVWARIINDDSEMPHRQHSFKEMDREKRGGNFWFLELGGSRDTIHDTERIRDELLALAFGIWDHVKNRGDHGAENWALDWVGFLPGKRESRRYAGDYILTQRDVVVDREFPDSVAYGGWPMDDHVPSGFDSLEPPTIFHDAASPYSIPYRSLYSKNIDNLFFAGRNISVSHMALCSTRVMGTCAILGQAIGTAAACALRTKCQTPREVLSHIKRLQQELLEDDCFLPGIKREIPALTLQAETKVSSGNYQALHSGTDRQLGNQDNSWTCAPGDWIEYSFSTPVEIKSSRIVFDSNFRRDVIMMKAMYFPDASLLSMPEGLVKSFTLEYRNAQGQWIALVEEKNNYRRLILNQHKIETGSIRLRINESWGHSRVRVFAFDVR